jgi:hypothetical protein
VNCFSLAARGTTDASADIEFILNARLARANGYHISVEVIEKRCCLLKYSAATFHVKRF